MMARYFLKPIMQEEAGAEAAAEAAATEVAAVAGPAEEEDAATAEAAAAAEVAAAAEAVVGATGSQLYSRRISRCTYVLALGPGMTCSHKHG